MCFQLQYSVFFRNAFQVESDEVIDIGPLLKT